MEIAPIIMGTKESKMAKHNPSRQIRFPISFTQTPVSSEISLINSNMYFGKCSSHGGQQAIQLPPQSLVNVPMN